ncbi:N-acetylglucosamine/diacetylchitobiose ABC transporter substrate-binding protein [Propionibacteriaceae bacterium Y2011]|uniref:N-acetylglucosamine/diacetylchitobiose ABC transporter substrate-binding protein n=1 Tax=Microlunatus sp. Y2014 TaxID=3418488 RepID=UPI003B47D4C4
MTSGLNRRAFLRGAGVAAGAVIGAGALASCAGGGAGPGTQGGGEGGEGVQYNFDDAANPFGLAEEGAGEVVIPDQGWGTKWMEDTIAAFKTNHGGIEIEMSAHKDMNVTIQPRFIQNDPPDLIMPAGIKVPVLAEQNQVFDLTEFYKAPAFDGGGTVTDSLLPGTMEAANLLSDGRLMIAPTTFTSYGLWYSSAVFEENGWEYPKTWDAMIALCEEIKGTGIAPWTYTGKYPGYIFTPMSVMAAKADGIESILAIDNLEPNAWRAPGMVAAAEAIEELRSKGYFLPGSEGLSHTESQTLWAQGKAAFIPVGSWLENESADSIKPESKIKMQSTPSLSSSDKLPFEALAAYPGNSVFVPEQAKNVQFGLEFLRFMWGKEASAIWTTNTKSLTSLRGYYDELTDVPSGLQSVLDSIEAAGEDILPPRKYSSYYSDFSKLVTDKTGLLASGTIKAKEYIDTIQAEADKVAADPNIKKYTRTLD